MSALHDGAGVISRSWRTFLNSGESRERTPLFVQPVSLLWPGEAPRIAHQQPSWTVDLNINNFVQALSAERRYREFIHDVLVALTPDPQVIAWRRAVMMDFMNNPQLAEQVHQLLSNLADLKRSTNLFGKRTRSLLLETSDRLAELDLYTELVEALGRILQGCDLRSQALLSLRGSLAELIEDENFITLRQELPVLRKPLENIASLTIGVNLDVHLQPESAVLLAINDFRLGAPASLLTRLIGLDHATTSSDDTGIAQLHRLIKDPDIRVLSPLFQDLDRLLEAVARPVARSLERYTRFSSHTLANLEHEFAFFVAAARLLHRLRGEGVPLCLPQIADCDPCITQINNLRSINLLVTDAASVVASDVIMDETGRIAILTGPNSGGKTTYLQSVGLAQIMFQAGMSIPAESARMTPVDKILTHFPRLETGEQGRLAEEARRLRTLFQSVTRRSLVLLNETFSSTTSGEAIYLAQDVLGGLRAIGARAIYATHFVELVEQIEEIHEMVPGSSDLFCLVADIRITDEGKTVPSFKIARGKPLGRSYAQEIARQHGISLEQILAEQSKQG